MKNTPFMPLWVADFVGDTLDLDAKEVGAYMLILMTMWGRDGTLPNDQKKLQRVARCGRDWPKVWDAIGRYFTVEGDTITQGRLRKELQKVAVKREVNAQSGARGGRAKALKEKNSHLANAKVSPQQPEPEPDIGGDSAYARAEILPDDLTPREHLLAAMGLTSGITATGRMLGNQGDMAEVQRWAEMGLTLDQQCAVISEVMAKKLDGPPSSFRYFSGAMQRRAGALSAPPLSPVAGQPQGKRSSGYLSVVPMKAETKMPHENVAKMIRLGAVAHVTQTMAGAAIKAGAITVDECRKAGVI